MEILEADVIDLVRRNDPDFIAGVGTGSRDVVPSIRVGTDAPDILGSIKIIQIETE